MAKMNKASSSSPSQDGASSRSTAESPTAKPAAQEAPKVASPPAQKPMINISKAPSASASVGARSGGDTTIGGVQRSGLGQSGLPQTFEAWEGKALSEIFRITLDPENRKTAHGQSLNYAEELKSDLEQRGDPIRLSTEVGVLDEALREVATNLYPDVTPMDYFLECWKRVCRFPRTSRTYKADNPKMVASLKEARRLCISNCIFALTLPDMFG
jgi:ubiquitin conjugation factor E4 B